MSKKLKSLKIKILNFALFRFVTYDKMMSEKHLNILNIKSNKIALVI